MKNYSKKLTDYIDEVVDIMDRHNNKTRELHLTFGDSLFKLLSKEQLKEIYNRYQGINIYFIKGDKDYLLNSEGELI